MMSPRLAELEADFKKNGGCFKKFKIGDLLEGETGDVDLQMTDVNGKGELFINSGVSNFGIKGRTDRQAKIFPSNTITVDFFGNAYYRSEPYKLATHNHVFSFSGEVIKNRLVGVYLVGAMAVLRRHQYSFNRMATMPVIKEEIICLPYSKDSIDFQYMADYIRELEADYIRELEAYLVASGLNDYHLTEKENAVLRDFPSQKKIRVQKLFDIHPTQAYKLRNAELQLGEGCNPVIANTSQNNGVTGYSPLECTEEGNILTYSDTTDANTIFYQPRAFIGYPHVQGLYPKLYEDDWSEQSLLYFASLIKKIAFTKGFNYGNKFRRDIMGNFEVSLPTTPEGAPDFEYMSTFVTAIKKLVIADVVKFKDDYIAKTKSVSSSKD
jgi:hypothetical protein